MISKVILFFILGSVIGSFLNVLIYRLPKGKSILGRSRCDNCKKNLLWHDLIPLLSYIFLLGKCRFCKKKIDLQMPLAELTTALFFVLISLKFSNIVDIDLWYFLFFVSSLIAIFFIDLKSGIIPNMVIYPLFIVSLIYLFLNGNLINNIIVSFFTFLFFSLIFILTKGRGIGFGDVKFASVLGLIFGFPQTIILLYLAFLTGAFVSLILILWGKKHLRGDTIAFGPFLVLGTFFVIFFGEQLVLLLSNFW